MLRPAWFISSLIFALSITSSPPVLAQGGPTCFVEQAKLLATDTAAGDRMGSSVSLDGDTALVGAALDDANQPNSGSAFVFVRNGTSWTQQAKLVASDGSTGDNFGTSVGVSGDTALVGAAFDDDNGTSSGSVYVFVRTGTSWTQQAKLIASDGAASDYFGLSVAVSGDTALVGAELDDDNAFNAGSAYVFVRNGTSWTQQAKLLPADGAGSDLFGSSVCLDGDTAFVGALGDDDNGNDSGSAYVFVRSGGTWTEQAKFLASDGAAADWFGESVAVLADTALVGAPQDDDNGGKSGSAYVFVRNGTSWTERAKLLASDGTPLDFFGDSVSLSGDSALVGAWQWDDGGGGDTGSAYVFVRSGTNWAQQTKLLASDSELLNEFGHTACLSGDTALVGAPGNDDFGFNTGSAYVFVLPPQSGTVYCTCVAGACGNPDPDGGCANSTGRGALLTAYGLTLPDEVNLVISGARSGQPAIFFQADNAVMLPFGDGFRCAGGGVVRINAPAPIGPTGSATFGPCFGDPTISSITGVVPGSGDTKRYQFWYRDPGGPCGSNFNLSNGYEITW